MKEVGTQYWNSPNTGATNTSGFGGLPGGHRFSSDGTFNDIGNTGFWWGSLDYNSTAAWDHHVNYNNGSAYKYGYDKANGLSVRCVKD